MAEPEYSNEAINVLKEFHRVTWMVYVEGGDDIPFWRILFEGVTDIDVAVEEVGGRPELGKYADRVQKNEIDVIVAMDSDYERICGEEIGHPRVLYTYGYAIENTMYSSEVVAKICQIYCRETKRDVNRSQEWLETFSEQFAQLVKYEIANYRFGKACRVLGDNCEQYMTSRNSSRVNEQSVSDREEIVKRFFTEEELEEIESVWTNYEGCTVSILRGHFLASAVRRFIMSEMRRHRKSGNLSNDALFANGIHALEAVLKRHPEYLFYKKQIVRALNASGS